MGCRGELPALISMEDLGLAGTGQGHLQGVQVESQVTAVGEFLSEHVPGEQVPNRYRLREAPASLDLNDTVAQAFW